MGRAPCCDKASVKRGPWSPDEDEALKNFFEKNGTGGNWISLPQRAGLKRCGKSCRLRWLNYLRPGIKHGGFSEEEDNVICSLYKSIGSRWSVIASHLPGRTDNDVKNYWNTKLKKKMLTRQADQSSNMQTYQNRSAPLLPKSEEFVFGPYSMSSDYYGGFGAFSASNENSSSSTLTSMECGFRFDSLSQDLSPSSLSTENSSGYGAGGIDTFLMDLGLIPADLLSAAGFGLLG